MISPTFSGIPNRDMPAMASGGYALLDLEQGSQAFLACLKSSAATTQAFASTQ